MGGGLRREVSSTKMQRKTHVVCYSPTVLLFRNPSPRLVISVILENRQDGYCSYY